MLRPILRKTKGYTGLITNFLAPDVSAEATKPFVFLDLLQGDAPDDFGFPYHPHSGIATLTYAVHMDIEYIDTEQHSGVLPAGGLEWMSAGGGAWHKARIPKGGEVCGIQLWIALPPKLEEGPSYSKYIAPQSVPRIDNVKVLLGTYRGVSSELATPHSMNYLDINLQEGEDFTYSVPEEHHQSFVLVYNGSATIQGEQVTRELVVFKPSGCLIKIHALTKANVIVASSVPHPHPLVAKRGSVHTSGDALKKGERRIAAIREELEGKGML